jgi:hypothetical protein
VQFDRAIALLHSFQFAPALQAFTAVTKLDPTCAMGHWGVAMSLLGDPFAWPPSARALADSWAAVGMARAAGARTQREQAYIAAIEAFCKDAETVDYRTRTLAYARTMAQLARQFPADPEATIFYALALNASALPSDKTCANQVKAATLLEQVFAVYPKHPGAAYYLAYIYEHRSFAPRGSTPHGQRPEHFWRIRNPGARWEDDWQASATERLRHFGTFHETAKVVNSLFGETLRIAELRPTNCQLAFERSRHFSVFCSALRSDYSQ